MLVKKLQGRRSMEKKERSKFLLQKNQMGVVKKKRRREREGEKKERDRRMNNSLQVPSPWEESPLLFSFAFGSTCFLTLFFSFLFSFLAFLEF
ncbi:hypothetical protein CSUI_004130 [Cystoisospora suis]|uniref:Transmembrane protein n=1 Tax=Cystoisospora suis TaxID=483139 RepID=A0A2C6L275_9APIC|nr:hypothetical protein CSUI_004130 [Cystoisospora suis]